MTDESVQPYGFMSGPTWPPVRLHEEKRLGTEFFVRLHLFLVRSTRFLRGLTQEGDGDILRGHGETGAGARGNFAAHMERGAGAPGFLWGHAGKNAPAKKSSTTVFFLSTTPFFLPTSDFSGSWTARDPLPTVASDDSGQFGIQRTDLTPGTARSRPTSGARCLRRTAVQGRCATLCSRDTV
jgi:hypothetical protein